MAPTGAAPRARRAQQGSGACLAGAKPDPRGRCFRRVLDVGRALILLVPQVRVSVRSGMRSGAGGYVAGML